MTAPDPTTEPADLDSELVAYLDGELDPQESRRIEELLSKDEQVRLRLRQLERAWDALDELPRTTVDESFTRSTVEMIAVQAGSDVEQMESDLKRSLLRRLAGVAGAALAAMVGFALIYYGWPDPNRQLVEDLPVLEHLDEYSQVQDIEFLRQLSAEKLFTAEAPRAP